MNVIESLSYNEKKLLLALDEVGGSTTPEEMIGSGKFDLEVEVMGAASWLSTKELVTITEEQTKYYALADREVLLKGLPERKALRAIHEAGGQMQMADLAKALPEGEDRIAIGWLKRKGLTEIKSSILSLTDQGSAVLKGEMPDEELLRELAAGRIPESDADPKMIKDLKGRQGMISEIIETERIISLTDGGRKALASGIELKEEITQMTDIIIQSGAWKNAEFRKYDINTFAPAVYPAKKHPLSRLGDEIRRMFTDMGFTEIDEEYVQPAFWDMDVLFVPQDHPARELQDTFYLDKPSRIPVDDEELIGKIRDIHEHGGDTGSAGWGGEWSRDMAEQAMLRTHTTVNTIAYVAAHPDAPAKAFSLSRIFRKESIDSTHLPEFTQIEGIIIDENGNFDMLVSVIKEFYSRMGFDTIRIRPAYFPYTEPSLELEVFFNGKWMELGGAGIFRPEVVAPFGVKHPVLAWGFGFERLAMLKWGITDIRDLYISDIDDLKNSRVF